MGLLDTFRYARLRDTLVSALNFFIDKENDSESKRQFLFRLLQGMINRNSWRG